MSSLASLDGEILPAAEAMIPATDEGLIRGDGVFEVIRVYDGTPFALEEHFARLERSAANIRLPIDLEAVRADTHRLLAEAGPGPDHEALRIVLTRGGRRLLLTEPLHGSAGAIRVTAVTYAPTRILDGVKSLSYAANMLARRLAEERGFDEAVLVTPHGRVLEGPTSALFWVADGELLTPPLDDHILDSITRRVVLTAAGAREASCTLDELQGAEEAFLASTIREVQPISAVDDVELPSDRPVTTRVADAVRTHIAARLQSG
jgi:branched-chain amino acid aminotransferase